MYKKMNTTKMKTPTKSGVPLCGSVTRWRACCGTCCCAVARGPSGSGGRGPRAALSCRYTGRRSRWRTRAPPPGSPCSPPSGCGASPSARRRTRAPPGGLPTHHTVKKVLKKRYRFCGGEQRLVRKTRTRRRHCQS